MRIQIRSVRQCGKNLRYEREGKTLKFWGFTSSDPVTIVGSWYLDVDCWPANFTEIMVWNFAAIIASSVIQDEGLAGHAAKMADDPVLKIAFYTLSAMPAWARINDRRHYLSQAMLGWWFAYLAADVADRTERFQRNFILTPIMTGDAAGLQAACFW